MSMMDHSNILELLRQSDPRVVEELFRHADRVRQRHVGDEVHLRGLIEFGNVCARRCAYCGLAATRTNLERYRMSAEEILDCAQAARSYGYGTVVLQSGEDPACDPDWLAEVIQVIKSRTGLAVTLSVGERSDEDLRRWRHAGADRYLLRFETSNPALLARIRPTCETEPGRDRVEQLRTMRDMGYEIGSGVMIGIPGQTYDDLADDILRFAELDLDMIGVGPFIAHPSTPAAALPPAEPGRQTPATEEMTYRVVALTRIVCPKANIPSTSALATLNRDAGRELGLQRGANVVMPNLTPPRYRALYEIYPAKACLRETAAHCHACMRSRIESIHRRIATGPGPSPRYLAAKPGQEMSG